MYELTADSIRLRVIDPKNRLLKGHASCDFVVTLFMRDVGRENPSYSFHLISLLC
jgi:hypothetical protein